MARRAAAGTSKSQLYHYFGDRGALLRELVAVQSERNLEPQRPTLGRLDSWAPLERWFDEIVAIKAVGVLVLNAAELEACSLGDSSPKPAVLHDFGLGLVQAARGVSFALANANKDATPRVHPAFPQAPGELP